MVMTKWESMIGDKLSDLRVADDKNADLIRALYEVVAAHFPFRGQLEEYTIDGNHLVGSYNSVRAFDVWAVKGSYSIRDSEGIGTHVCDQQTALDVMAAAMAKIMFQHARRG
jgi:hypothetical protein